MHGMVNTQPKVMLFTYAIGAHFLSPNLVQPKINLGKVDNLLKTMCMNIIAMDIITWADPIGICLMQENLHAIELRKQPAKLHLQGIQKKKMQLAKFHSFK
jgi:hypothetical protein